MDGRTLEDSRGDSDGFETDMNWLAFISGLGLFIIGVNVGFLLAHKQVEESLRLLNEAKKWHKKIQDDLLRFQEQTRK